MQHHVISLAAAREARHPALTDEQREKAVRTVWRRVREEGYVPFCRSYISRPIHTVTDVQVLAYILSMAECARKDIERTDADPAAVLTFHPPIN